MIQCCHIYFQDLKLAMNLAQLVPNPLALRDTVFTYPFTWRDPLQECLSLGSNKSEWKGKERLCQLILEIFGKRMMNLETLEVWPKSQTGGYSGATFPWHLCVLASSEERAALSRLFRTLQPHLWDNSKHIFSSVGKNFVPCFPYPLSFLCFLPPKGSWNT